MNDMTDIVQEAMNKYVRNKTCIIWYGETNIREKIGTGSLFFYNNEFIVCTCQHVAEEFKKAKSASISLNNRLKIDRNFIKFIKWDRLYDIALIGIQPFSIFDSYFTLDDIKVIDDFKSLKIDEQGFLVYGFPAEHCEIIDDKRILEGMSLFTELHQTKTSNSTDLFLSYPYSKRIKINSNLNGKELPEADGISGSLVFSVPIFKNTDDGIWNTKLAKIVAIENSSDNSTYIKCSNAKFIIDIFESL